MMHEVSQAEMGIFIFYISLESQELLNFSR